MGKLTSRSPSWLGLGVSRCSRFYQGSPVAATWAAWEQNLFIEGVCGSLREMSIGQKLDRCHRDWHACKWEGAGVGHRESKKVCMIVAGLVASDFVLLVTRMIRENLPCQSCSVRPGSSTTVDDVWCSSPSELSRLHQARPHPDQSRSRCNLKCLPLGSTEISSVKNAAWFVTNTNTRATFLSDISIHA